MDLSGYQYVWLIVTFIVGFFALRQLIFVKEEGEVEEKVVMSHFYAQVRQAVRHISNVAGLRHLTNFPFAVLKTVTGRVTRKAKDVDPSNCAPRQTISGDTGK